MSLTLKQRRVLDFLEQYFAERRLMPSHQEIADRFGYRSLSTVHEHLLHLERKGYLRRQANEARALELLPERVRGDRGLLAEAAIALRIVLERSPDRVDANYLDGLAVRLERAAA